MFSPCLVDFGRLQTGNRTYCFASTSTTRRAAEAPFRKSWSTQIAGDLRTADSPRVPVHSGVSGPVFFCFFLSLLVFVFVCFLLLFLRGFGCLTEKLSRDRGVRMGLSQEGKLQHGKLPERFPKTTERFPETLLKGNNGENISPISRVPILGQSQLVQRGWPMF